MLLPEPQGLPGLCGFPVERPLLPSLRPAAPAYQGLQQELGAIVELGQPVKGSCLTSLLLNLLVTLNFTEAGR